MTVDHEFMLQESFPKSSNPPRVLQTFLSLLFILEPRWKLANSKKSSRVARPVMKSNGPMFRCHGLVRKNNIPELNVLQQQNVPKVKVLLLIYHDISHN